MRLKRSISFIAAGAAVAILVFFYFPWIPTSIGGADAVSLSGSDLAAGAKNQPAISEMALRVPALFVPEQGDPKLYVIPGAAMVALFMAFLGYLKPKLHTSTIALLAYIVPSLFGMVLMLWEYSQISAVAAEEGTAAASSSMVVVSYAPGWYVTFVSLVILFATGAILFLEYTAKPSMLAGAEKLKKEKLATSTLSAVDAAEHTLALLAEASKLIKARRYHIARELLDNLDHPTALRWLQELDHLIKRETQPAPQVPVYQTTEMPVLAQASIPDDANDAAELVLAKLAAARNLIATKRYPEAQRLLTGIDHPTAQRWLEKLDEVQNLARSA